MKIRENVKISELTTMKIGGKARYVFEVEDTADLINLRKTILDHDVHHYYFLGSGANTFATDEDFDGVIIINKIDILETKEKRDLIMFRAYGGMDWDKFVEKTVELGCTGVECLAGIPGTVGAGPVQNIGAYGQEIKDKLTAVFALDMVTNECVKLKPEECDFSYRHSIFNSSKQGQYFIYAVDFTLEKGEMKGELYKSLQGYLDEKGISSREPKVIAKAVREIRDSKLPKVGEEASSGSFFKNVYVSESEVSELDEKGIPHHGTKVNTAWLIEKAGVKGKTFHGFRVSEKAPLVLINDSGKTYADLEKAVKEISEIVFKETGFKIEQEPNVIGK